MQKCKGNLRPLFPIPTLSLFTDDPQTSAHPSLRLALDNDFNRRAAAPHFMPLYEQHPGTAIPVLL